MDSIGNAWRKLHVCICALLYLFPCCVDEIGNLLGINISVVYDICTGDTDVNNNYINAYNTQNIRLRGHARDIYARAYIKYTWTISQLYTGAQKQLSVITGATAAPILHAVYSPEGHAAIAAELRKHGIEFTVGKKFTYTRDGKHKFLRVDFYIPLVNAIVEYNTDRFGDNRYGMCIKEQWCCETGVILLRILPDDIPNIHNIMNKFIGEAPGADRKNRSELIWH